MTSAVKSTIMPGDIRYKDLNGDHIIDIHDQTNLGSKKAKGYYGISAGFNYKGFDFSVFAQGTLNRQVYLNGDFMDGSGKKARVLSLLMFWDAGLPTIILILKLVYGMIVITTIGRLLHFGYMMQIISA